VGGRNGVRTITRFPVDDLPVTVAGEVDFDPLDHLDAKEARRTDRFTQFRVAAAKLAWADAGDPQIVAERGGVIFATGIGGIETLLNAYDVLKNKGPGRVSPFMVPMLMANAPAGHIAMTFGLTGANFATVSACSSSNHAIFEAMRLLRDGTLDLCVAGGSESATLPLTVAAFSQMTALTKNPDPEVASRPFAPSETASTSEGACALIMAPRPRKARGARITARLPVRGASDDAFHITAPDPKGSVPCSRCAGAETRGPSRARSTINAHGTTPLNDASGRRHHTVLATTRRRWPSRPPSP
jgi:3-oxoacyl-[acyl-carrier-protein] synthase II